MINLRLQQLLALDRAGDKAAFALFMEQRTGKTTTTFARALDMHRRGLIDAMVVVVFPNGVQTTWTDLEPNSNWPGQCLTAEFGLGMTKKEIARAQAVIESFEPKLKVFATNVETAQYPKGVRILERLLRSMRCLFVIDEATSIKTNKAQRTKAIVRLGRLAPYRLILTGTPLTRSPLDLYPMFQFLQPGSLGAADFTSYKNLYAEWRTRVLQKGSGRTHEFKEVVKWKNLDQLRSRVKAMSYECRRKDCFDLPPKIYRETNIRTNSEFQSLYKRHVKEFRLELESGTLEMPNILARLQRLHCLSSGWQPHSDGTKPALVWAGKVDALNSYIENLHDDVSVIVFARFVHELELIRAQLCATYGEDKVVDYWGDTKAAQRAQNVALFQSRKARFFVANQRAAGYGLDLTAASEVIYFSNSWSVEHRLQSEDRTQGPKQTLACAYTDLLTEGTIDLKVLKNLKAGKSLEQILSRDDIKELISE